jgi:phosphatidate cytidylyltransferase
MSPLLQRTLTIAIALPLVLGWLWAAKVYDQFWLIPLLLALVTGLAGREFTQLMGKLDISLNPTFFTAISVAAVLALGFFPDHRWLILTGALLIVWLWSLSRRPPEQGVRTAAAATLGLFYLPYLLGFAYEILRPEAGFSWMLLALGLVWAYDSGAYLAGSRWGRRRLSPQLSPSKTWEGVLGGLVLASLAAVIGLWTLMPQAAWVVRLGHALGLSLSVSAAAQLGDLFESMLKRAAGVKDTGGLFPGHGGMLDRIDAVLFALPVFSFYLRYLLGWG